MEPTENETKALRLVNEALKELSGSANADTKKVIAMRKKLINVRGELKALMVRSESLAEQRAFRKVDQ